MPEDDPEVKIEIKSAAVAVMSTSQDDPVDRIIRYHSSWYRLQKCIAFKILRYRQKLLQACRRRKEGVAKPLVTEKAEPISLEEMKSSEKEILKHVQKRSFKEEMSCHLSKKEKDKEPSRNSKRSAHLVSKSSLIYKLDPLQVDELFVLADAFVMHRFWKKQNIFLTAKETPRHWPNSQALSLNLWTLKKETCVVVEREVLDNQGMDFSAKCCESICEL